ncbi:uncharacterized protein AAG666_009141 isoform 3-T7 [Megaptera novaeangliae]
MQKLLITFRNDEQKIGDRPLLKCFGNCSSFTFLLWQGSAEKSPKMLSTVKDSHWLKNNGSLVWCQNRKQCSKPISFRIPPEGSTKTLLSQAKARGQVTVVGRPACVCIPGAPRNLPVCEMISWFLLHVSNVYPTKNWMELTAEQRLER